MKKYVTCRMGPNEKGWLYLVAQVDHAGPDISSDITSFKFVAEKEFERESDGFAWAETWAADAMGTVNAHLQH
jgi:hypothetical protein